MADRIEALFRLDGQRALVTGASSGLGRRFALTLAQAGAEVIVVARRADKLNGLLAQMESLSAKCLAVNLDVTQPSSIVACRLEDLDGPLLLLASDAGRHMTGAVIAVDGGHLVSSL